jgi:acetyl-CoA acetyltransferase
MVWGGGGSGACGSLAHAVAAVESGQAANVLVFRSIVQRPGSRYGEAGGFSEVPQIDILAPFGMLMPSSMMAPVFLRYMHEYGIRTEHLAEIALTFRDNAQRNPRAVMRGLPLTMEQYLAARMISEPLRLYDCCQENDGACALLVTTVERARDLRGNAVRVLAAQQGGNAGWGAATMGTHTMPAAEYGWGNGEQLARDLYAAAGVAPADMDFAQIYDHFTPAVLMTLENFGLCGRGEAGDFVSAGHIRPDGSLPLNTSGGLLSEAYIHGLNLVAEAVRQLRGESTSQVPGARVGLVTAGLGSTPFSAAILAA